MDDTAIPQVRISPRETQVVEIILPRENTVDVLAVTTLLNTLSTGSLFSLEIAGDHQMCRFLVRGTPEAVAHIQRQLQATYDQADFKMLDPEQDPGRPSPLPTAGAQLTLARTAQLPVRTYQDGDFEKADPIKGLLGALDGLQADERALVQIILAPASPQWSQRYESMARQSGGHAVENALAPNVIARQFFSLVAMLSMISFGLWAMFAFIQKAWLTFLVAGVLFSFAAYGVVWLYSLLLEQSSLDPKLVQTKIETPAYDTHIRLFVVGQTRASAERKLRELVAAYRQFNLQSGNAFVGHLAEFDPRVLALDRPSWLKELTGRVMRLSINELASLWHLPVGKDIPRVRHALYKRVLPLPMDVEKGILVGHSAHQGQRIAVHLDERALWHHIFMVAKTQKGKSTLMAHLAAEAMRQNTALVVIDPHGDLARSLLGLVPRARASDVLYVDFSDPHQVVGLNLLDMAQGRKADTIVSNLVHVGELIWSDNWGPRMEDAFRMALRTLLAANTILAQEHQPQFTLLDIPRLFELPYFRHRLIEQYITAKDIREWWSNYFERLYENLRLDVVNPVLTKLHRFSTHETIRAIVGQSNSTIHFRELVSDRRILIVNTATGIIGPDAGGLLGAVIVDYINFAVREQMAIPDPAARARVLVVVDEFQSIPGVDYPKLLAELEKMGASFILATQALGQLDALDLKLRQSILSNAGALFIFQTSAEDADLLRGELDSVVTVTDVINLDDYTCYLKTQLDHKRLPMLYLETLPPAQGDREVVATITAQMARYTRSLVVVESLRDGFETDWFGREQNVDRQLKSDSNRNANSTGKNTETRGGQTSQKTNAAPPKQDERKPASTPPGQSPHSENTQPTRQDKDSRIAGANSNDEPISFVGTSKDARDELNAQQPNEQPTISTRQGDAQSGISNPDSSQVRSQPEDVQSASDEARADGDTTQPGFSALEQGSKSNQVMPDGAVPGVDGIQPQVENLKSDDASNADGVKAHSGADDTQFKDASQSEGSTDSLKSASKNKVKNEKRGANP